ncbi:MAG: OB-fold nucleic acid binding domain-containing protein, partial [Actinomycetota bacterium]
GKADRVRKAIGKKDRALMAEEEPVFIEGCKRFGLSEQEAVKLWGLIQPFADYSFNRAHSASYAYVAYQTGWLKAHYPVEYMAALLTSVKDDKDAKPYYLHIARKMGLDILLPDVNSSDKDFTPVGESVRFGLAGIRGVGEGVVERIVEARRAKGPFTSFYDFCRKVDYTCLNKKTIESLIKAGAFESLHSPAHPHTRKGLLETFENICGDVISQRKQEEAGQFSLFRGASEGDEAEQHEVPIPVDEYPKELLRSCEKEVLGQYVSDHPLLGVEGLLSRMTDASLAALARRVPGEVLTVGGLVTNVSKKVTKRGDIMLLLGLEDLSGAAVEVVVFARTYEQYANVLRPDAILLIRGRVDRDARDDSVKVIAMEVFEPDLGEEKPLVINLPLDACTDGVVERLKEVLANHPGATQVFLHLARGTRTTVLRLGSEYWVDTTNGLHAELKALLGPAVLISA